MAAVGDIVLYVCRKRPTKRDPRGFGAPGPANPLTFWEVPAIVLGVITVNRLVLRVFSYSDFLDEDSRQFVPATPRPNTWKVKP